MQLMQKKKTKILMSFLLGVSLLLNEIPFCVKAETQTGKEKAVLWLKEAGGEVQRWGDGVLPNDTCDALAVLRKEGIETDSTYLKEWEQEHAKRNVDEQAHLAWAWKDLKYLDAVWEQQNKDGGFGLEGDYASDVYDTFLVLSAQAAIREQNPMSKEESEENLEKLSERVLHAVDYLMEQQRPEGGFGYTKAEPVNPGLSAEIGLAVLTLGIEADAFYKKLDRYCQSVFQADFSEDAFYGQAELARYLYRRGKIEDAPAVEEKLYAAQNGDGSIYGNIRDTIQYILLAGEIEAYHEIRFEVERLMTDSDSYVLEADTKQKISLRTDMAYTINQELKGVIRYTLLEDGEILQIREQECTFAADRTQETVEGPAMEITASEGKRYVFRTEVISEDETGKETIWKSGEFEFTVHKAEEQDFLLKAETSGGEGCSAALSWNDISDKDNRYGYRVFRKKEDSEWETRSTWDGEEKVKVLNIYPIDQAKEYLVKWMEETISDSEEPAGMGLFEIDTVNIYDYNYRPDSYLMDEKGDYQYDVLVFGTYDSNAFWDLSQTAYDATQRFLDTGRGALFGHDTVAEYHGNHKTQFPKFGERMGIKLIRDGHLKGGNRVRVVKNGILTKYPWKLTGTLTIPESHVAGQYAGGTLPSVIWMEFQNDYLTDEETGAKNNAYLLSKDAIAVIQTGHSNGQATDDERKVLANTLFYLKQLTNRTNAADKSFYDEAAPEVIEVSEMNTNHKVAIRAEDRGTRYQYYAEAVGAGNRDEEGRRSNIVEAEALSGIKGYIIGTSNAQAPMENLILHDEEGNLTSTVIPAPGGQLDYAVESLEPGQSVYLHIYAVDHAGNISQEKVCKVLMPEQEPEVSEKEYFRSPYALFASEDEAEIGCCEARINGDIYGGKGFRFQGTTLLLEGTASTAGTLSLAGGKMELTGREEGIRPVVLPDYTDAILKDIEENDTVDEISAYNSREITIPTICRSTTGAWCNDVKIGASLFSEKTVSLNANTISCGADTSVVMCSRNGDISIQSTKFNGSGLIYAPNGTVIINVSEFNYRGTIIAKKIKIQAGYMNINQDR